VAIASYAGAPSANPYVLAVTLLVGVVDVSVRLRKKGVRLDDEQYRVLMALKRTDPIDEAQLALLLNGLYVTGARGPSPAQVRVILTSLRSVLANDGTIEVLVNELDDGRWSSNGV
jgi:hypothetical protein